MVKITYETFKEVVIKEYVRFERIEDLTSIFAKVRAGGALVSPPTWLKVWCLFRIVYSLVLFN